MISNRMNAPASGDPSPATTSLFRRGSRSVARSCARHLRRPAVPHPAPHHLYAPSVRRLLPGDGVASFFKSHEYHCGV